MAAHGRPLRRVLRPPAFQRHQQAGQVGRGDAGDAPGLAESRGADAAEVLALPPAHRVEVFVAIGRRGDPSSLPDWAKARERPNERRPLAELVREGSFGG